MLHMEHLFFHKNIHIFRGPLEMILLSGDTLKMIGTVQDCLTLPSVIRRRVTIKPYLPVQFIYLTLITEIKLH